MMAANKKIVLITGANSGLGFGLAAQLMEMGDYHVLLAARSAEKGAAALDRLGARGFHGTAELVVLDVTDDTSIAAAVATVEKSHARLDILVNNAAVASTASTLREQFCTDFETNAASAYLVAAAFIPLLLKSTQPRIVNISSGAGSIGRRLDSTLPSYKMPALAYRTSKAALNMISACLWAEHGPHVKVFTYNPGFVVSNLGPQNREENGARPVEEVIQPLVDVLAGVKDEMAGQTFLNFNGTYPW